MKKGIVLGLLLISLSGCRVITSAPPTEMPTSPPPTPTTAPSATPAPILPTSTPTMLPTATSTSQPVVIEQPEVIDIQYPFTTGKVPPTGFTIQGMADPTFEQNLVIRLVDMDGNEILLQPTTIQADIGMRGLFSQQLEFNEKLSTNAMLQVFSHSVKDGSLEHLNSRMLTFDAEPDAPKDLFPQTEKILITDLRVGQVNTRLELQAEGVAVGIFENTLEFKLCGEGGIGTSDFVCGGADNVITSGVVQVNAPDVGQPGTFSIRAEIPNGKWKTGRLVVYATSVANGEIEHASSAIIKNGP